MRGFIIGILFALTLTGCATQIPPEVIAHADYGRPPPKDYKHIIKESFGKVLIDPTSPIYEFSPLSKGYTMQSSFFGTQQMFGWRVCGTVNSKNRFGGYVGRVPFFVLFRNGVIAYQSIGEAVSGEDISILNAAINKACNR